MPPARPKLTKGMLLEIKNANIIILLLEKIKDEKTGRASWKCLFSYASGETINKVVQEKAIIHRILKRELIILV